MSTVLIAYGTTEGQTATIAEYIADALRAQGHLAEAYDVHDLPDGIPDRFEAVLVGASVHMGKHDKHVVELVERTLPRLEALPSGFFSVSLAAHGDGEEAQSYLDDFEHETGWHPDHVALFAGALLYTRYGFLKRRLMKKIAQDKPGGLGVDTSRDYVYTEWDGVRRFVDDFAAGLPAAA